MATPIATPLQFEKSSTMQKKKKKIIRINKLPVGCPQGNVVHELHYDGSYQNNF